MTEAIILE